MFLPIPAEWPPIATTPPMQGPVGAVDLSNSSRFIIADILFVFSPDAVT